MEGMFNPISILLHVANAVILLVALYFLLVKPVRRFMDKRAQGIEEQMKSAADAQAEVERERKAARRLSGISGPLTQPPSQELSSANTWL